MLCTYPDYGHMLDLILEAGWLLTGALLSHGVLLSGLLVGSDDGVRVWWSRMS